MDGSAVVPAPHRLASESPAPVPSSSFSAAPAAADVSAQVPGQLLSVKKKRGRPPKSASAKHLTPATKKHPANTLHINHNPPDEEDVCFICFDGGDLVLCDRRACPKAYHPTCIKRDEAFFKSKAKWNCGWHICSNCQRASHFFCYTCTFSLCKRCTGKADFLCVRENNGFCTTCMRTIMLIEEPLHEKDTVQVDFDDKSSWEYLFKVYWVYLKTKISLTLDELKKAKSPDKVSALVVGKGKISDALYEPGDDKDADSDGFTGYLEVMSTSKRKKTNRWSKFPDKESFEVQSVNGEIVLSPSVGSEWCSKDLMEFVAHMKNGDTSVLSQSDVQDLLLEYIKRNNLRDPHRKSQIICDARLKSMFGKPRVGHFEMLKLLEYHFLVKEDSHADSVVHGGFIGAVSGLVATDQFNGSLAVGKDKRRKTRRKGNDRGPPTNLDEYAAIDVHNITLIFLQRNLLENLIQDADNFTDKVVGSVVRIKVTNNDQKQDMYRLVQVVGTSRVDVPYKIGGRMADCKLEVLNLNKKEVISIDEISNQDFSEDECKRLRQCIKCGLAKRLSVGEVLDKAMALRAAKVNDLIEAEILRLNHLRDRASEKGHRKELRECVEKLQLLNTPEERHRRQHEVPEIHADPNMDPGHESDDDAGESYQKKQGDNVGIVEQTGARKRGRKPNSAVRGGETSNNPKGRTRKQMSSSLDQNRSAFTSGRVQEVANGSFRHQGREAYGSHENLRNLYDSASLAMSAWNKPVVARMESISGAALGTSIMSHSAGMVPSSSESEIEKMWHYQDPSGKIQGPFSLLQLRKWSTSGYFPPDLRIWKINEQQDNSFLLTDALDGLYHKKQRLNNNNDVARSLCASSWSNPADISSREGLEGKFSQGRDSGAHESFSNHSQLYSSLSSATFSEKPHDTTSHRVRETRDSETGHEQIPSTSEMPGFHNCGDSYQKSPESSRQDLNNQPMNCSLSSGSFSSSIISAAKILSEMPGQNVEVDYSNLPSPTPKLSSEDLKVDGAETTQATASNIPDSGTVLSQSSPSSQTSGRIPKSDPSSPTPKLITDDVGVQMTVNELFDSLDVPQLNSGPCECSPNCRREEGSFPIPASSLCKEDSKVQTAENNVILSSECPAPNSEPSCSSLMNVVQLPGVANEWGGHSAPPNHLECWDSSALSGSTLKPDDLATGLAVPSPSTSDQLALPSPSSLTPHASTWHAMMGGPNEFPLAEESVSDLLAEVDAMESLNGPASPTSAMNCSLEFAHDNKDDFSADEALSPTPNPVKSDGFSSTGDVPLPQSFRKDEPKGGLHTNVIDSQKVVVNESPCTEFEEETKPAGVSTNQLEADSTREQPIQSTMNWSIPETEKDIHRGAGQPARDSGWGKMQGSGELGCGGQAHNNTNNMSWAHSRGGATPNLNWTVSPGHQGMWGNQPKFGESRFSSPRERNYHGGHSGFGRDRPSWNRQSSFGGGGGNNNSSSRPLPKGQRVCKFYESGRCKKGASCSYLHP